MDIDRNIPVEIMSSCLLKTRMFTVEIIEGQGVCPKPVRMGSHDKNYLFLHGYKKDTVVEDQGALSDASSAQVSCSGVKLRLKETP